MVEQAFLEIMQPSLEEVIGALVGSGVGEIVVIPVFLVKVVTYATISQCC